MRILILFIIFSCGWHISSYAQLKTDSTDTVTVQQDTLQAVTSGDRVHDSVNAQKVKADSLVANVAHVVPPVEKNYQAVLNRLLPLNKFLNVSQKPVFFVNEKRQANGKEYLFYLVSAIILVFGIFKVFYGRYFNNIFRVFFNTSLRQNQLTDLLLQARLPSLIFNVFFIITGGLYIWLLIPHFYPVSRNYNTTMLIFCIVGTGLIYVARFCLLKFIGWVTGNSTALNTYIFVIFLVSKIIGIALIPLILVLAFAPPVFLKSAILISFLLLAVFFLVRFFRSYSLLHQQLHISRFHFLLYIISLEILPMLVIYKISQTFLLRL